VGGNLGDAEGLTDDAEIEDAMAKECEKRVPTIEHRAIRHPPPFFDPRRLAGEERGRKFASNYKSLQEKFPYVAPKPPAGYSLEEMESLTSKPRSKPGSVVSGSVVGSELRRSFSLPHPLPIFLPFSLNPSLTPSPAPRLHPSLHPSLPHSLTHSLTHSIPHSLTHLLTYLLTHSLIHICRYSTRISCSPQSRPAF
jgi:hypothetical protein